MHTPRTSRHPRESGFVLIASLLMLIVMTFLAISLYHNFTVHENIASNAKEKGRAFQIAQSTLQYAEYSLLQVSGTRLPTPVSCPAGTALTAFTICLTAVDVAAPTSSAAMLLSNGMNYTAVPNMTISTSGGATSYYGDPQYQIEYLGASPGGVGQIYQITALGYGATQNAVAVVQSTYQLSSGVKNLGGL